MKTNSKAKRARHAWSKQILKKSCSIFTFQLADLTTVSRFFKWYRIWPLCGVFSRQVPQLEHPADADAASRDVAAVDVAQAPAGSQEVTSHCDEAVFLNDRAI